MGKCRGNPRGCPIIFNRLIVEMDKGRTRFYQGGEHDYYKGENKVRPYGLCIKCLYWVQAVGVCAEHKNVGAILVIAPYSMFALLLMRQLVNCLYGCGHWDA